MSARAPERESLQVLERTLEDMRSRLEVLLGAPTFTPEALVEITAIYNNVAYVFLYLEANEEHVKYDDLQPWRDRFHADPELDRRILAMLRSVTFEDAEAESSRQDYVAQLEDKEANPPDPRGTELLGRAKDLLAQVDTEQAKLIARITGRPVRGNASATLYRLSGASDSAEMRTKLARAWNLVSDRHAPELIGLLDEMVQVRREQSTAAGHNSVLAQTLTKCSVTETEIAKFIDAYLERAVEEHRELMTTVGVAVGGEDLPTAHFPRYMQLVASGRRPPKFDLQACLDFVFDVAEQIFGLQFTARREGDSPVIEVSIDREGSHVGQINCDLWNTATKTPGPSWTMGLRNRTAWGNQVQTPVAFVSCRFDRGDDEVERISFQNVHSLFHEFGHALNHVLIRRRISNQSGLEYLPLERLELMSMFFEKWVYHVDFAQAVGGDADGVRLGQRLKGLEYVRTFAERAAAAALDFEVHRRSQGTLSDCFGELDRRVGLGSVSRLEDLAVYFTWPMYQANPGANFSYLWGASASVEQFLPVADVPVPRLAEAVDADALFASCLDPCVEGPVPGTHAVFDFYADLAGSARGADSPVGG